MQTQQEQGQATVELALLIPLIMLLFLALAQIGVLVERQILVVHAAREGVREAAVNSDKRDVESAIRNRVALEGNRLRVTIDRGKTPGAIARVRVAYVDPTDMPLVGRLLPNVTLRAGLAMRIEQ